MDYAALYWRILTLIPERAASSADLRSLSVISPSTYASPQMVHTRAGTLLKTKVAPSLSKVTVAVPSLVRPFLQITHFMISFSSKIRLPF